MEISKRGSMHLYAERISEEKGGERKRYCLITKFIKGKDDEGLCVKFSGFMCWSIVRDGKEEILYSRGQYSLNQTDNKNEYSMKIDRLKEQIGTLMSDQLEKWFEDKWLEALIDVLKDQKHGTSVIIMDQGRNQKLDDEDEVMRLCKMNYGTLFAEKVAYRKDNEWDGEQLLSITSIDGALFMNLQGEGLAFGVIVDGIVKKPGNTGKGARYNSITNYVEQKDKGIYLGIIVSEDRMVELTCNLKEKA